MSESLFIHPTEADTPHTWGDLCAWSRCVPCDEAGHRLHVEAADGEMPVDVAEWLNEADDTSAAHALIECGFDGLPVVESTAEWATRQLEAGRSTQR